MREDPRGILVLLQVLGDDAVLEPAQKPDGLLVGARLLVQQDPLAVGAKGTDSPATAPARRLDHEVPAGAAGDAELLIHDVCGRLVRRVVPTFDATGLGSARWDGKSETGSILPEAVYFTYLRSGFGRAEGKVVLVR